MTTNFKPYGRQAIDESDIAAVCEVLRSDWLTTGPAIESLEHELCAAVGARHAVVCNSGTASLYLAARASGIRPGQAVIVPTVTFAASASAFLLAGIDVILADVDENTGLLTPDSLQEALGRAGSKPVRGVVPVHLQGRPADPMGIYEIAQREELFVIEDACHALGTSYNTPRQRIGDCAHSDMACFSFHPVKTIAMGEGGAITTNDNELADHMRRLRSHAITREAKHFQNQDLAYSADGTVNCWYYELHDISHNFRASDIHCALAASQLRKLDIFAKERRRLVSRYRKHLTGQNPHIYVLEQPNHCDPVWHLFCVLIDFDKLATERNAVMARLKRDGVGTQVHYIPLHMQPYFRRLCGDLRLPGAEEYYRRVLSLPLYFGLTDDDVDQVIAALLRAVSQ